MSQNRVARGHTKLLVFMAMKGDTLWETCGILMEYYIMDMDINGYQWILMDINGYQWILMDINGS